MHPIILITGSTSGIGYETAKALLKHPVHLILHGKSEAKLTQTINRLKSLYPNIQIDCFVADLSDQHEIAEMTQKIKSSYSKIDILINNAACVSSARSLTPENIELQLAVNHLAPLLLVHHLLPLLENSHQGRIINVNSRAHGRGSVYFDNLSLENSYNISKAYNQSKLANMFFNYYLSEKLLHSRITVNAMHPGLVNTDFGVKNASVFHKFIWNAMKFLGNKPENACKDLVFMALDKSLYDVSGKYFHNRKQINSSKESYNKQKQKKMWEMSLKLINIESQNYGKT